MLSCREASHLMSDRQERILRPWERLGLRLHLAMCRGCRRTEKQLRFIREAMSRLAGRS